MRIEIESENARTRPRILQVFSNIDSTNRVAMATQPKANFNCQRGELVGKQEEKAQSTIPGDWSLSTIHLDSSFFQFCYGPLTIEMPSLLPDAVIELLAEFC